MAAAEQMTGASWTVIGANAQHRGWGVQGRLDIRVDSDSPLQILITAILVAKDIVDSGRIDQVNVVAIGNWYSSEVTGMLGQSAEVIHSKEAPTGPFSDWEMSVAPRIPTPRELLVVQTWKKTAPKEYFEGSSNHEPDLRRDALQTQTDELVAEAFQMTSTEVRATVLSALRVRPNITVGRTSIPGCRRGDPGLICIDLDKIFKPKEFADAVKLINEACGDKESAHARTRQRVLEQDERIRQAQAERAAFGKSIANLSTEDQRTAIAKLHQDRGRADQVSQSAKDNFAAPDCIIGKLAF